MMRVRYLLSALAGVAAGVLLVVWRGFYWQHALLVGVAVAALVYSILRSADRLRSLHRR